MLAAFDAPTGDASCVRRSRANTPLQALTVLNETVFMEASQALALKVLTEGGKTDEEKLTLAFRRVLSRQPGKDEIKDLKNLLTKTRARAAEGWINPSELATGKTECPSSRLEPPPRNSRPTPPCRVCC